MKRIFEFTVWIALPFWLAMVSSCKDDVTSPKDIVFPDTLVSFKQHVQPLFNQTCITSGCHDGTATGVMPNLTSYYGVRHQTPNLVVPGKPELSILMITIEEANHDYPLPLTTNHVKGIKQWIIEGALDN